METGNRFFWIRPEKLFHLQNKPPVILQKRSYGWMYRNGSISKIPKNTCEGKVLSRISFPGKSDCFGLRRWKSPSVDTTTFVSKKISLGMGQTWAKLDKIITVWLVFISAEKTERGTGCWFQPIINPYSYHPKIFFTCWIFDTYQKKCRWMD